VGGGGGGAGGGGGGGGGGGRGGRGGGLGAWEGLDLCEYWEIETAALLCV
jgi:hypothetical protein